MGLPILNMDGYLLKQIKAETARANAADANLQNQINNINSEALKFNVPDLSMCTNINGDVTLNLGNALETFGTGYAYRHQPFTLTFNSDEKPKLFYCFFIMAVSAGVNGVLQMSAQWDRVYKGSNFDYIGGVNSTKISVGNTQGGPVWGTELGGVNSSVLVARDDASYYTGFVDMFFQQTDEKKGTISLNSTGFDVYKVNLPT